MYVGFQYLKLQTVIPIKSSFLESYVLPEYKLIHCFILTEYRGMDYNCTTVVEYGLNIWCDVYSNFSVKLVADCLTHDT